MQPARVLSSLLNRLARRWADVLAVGLGMASLVVSCVRRSDRVPMWADEIFSWNLLQDPSFPHMLRALGDQSDGGLPLYYTLARAWTAVFPLTELSLRLFTTVGTCAALAGLWVVLRRVYGFWPTLAGVSLVFGTSDTIRFENANVRFYGLFLALIVLAAGLAVELGARARPGRRWLVGNGLAQALLVICQPLGGLYSAALLAATAVGDWRAYRRVRWRVLGSYPAGWLVLGSWLPQLLRQAAINHPHGWVPVPNWDDLLTVNTAATGDFARLGLFLGIAGAAGAWFDQPAAGGATNKPTMGEGENARKKRLLLVGLALVAMLPFLWIFSRLVPTNSLFLARYVLGAGVGWAILLTQLTASVLNRPATPPHPGRWAVYGLTLGFALWNVYGLVGSDKKPDRFGWLGFSDPAFGHPELPIVCQRTMDFLPRVHYSPQAERYFYLLDPAAAIAPDNHFPGAVSENKLLGGLARNYGALYHGHIMETAAFLRTYPAFLLQDDPQTSFIARRLQPGEYHLTALTPTGPLAGLARRTYPILLVEKRP